MAKLIINENDRSVMHEILEDSLVVGSREGVTVRLSDPEAGGDHCQIRQVPGLGYKLIDLESRSGTKVNGAFVNQHLLRDGDVIQVGNARINFSDQGGPAAVIAPAPIATAVPASPAPAQAYAAAPARPPAYDRDYRPPARRGRPGGGGDPMLVMGIALGALVLVIIAIVLVTGSSGAAGNERIYNDMISMIERKNFDGALNLARQADPAGDQKFYAKIQAQIQSVEGKRASSQGLHREWDALRAYQKAETFALRNKADSAGIIEHWEGVIRDFPGTHYAFKSQEHIDRILGKVPAGGGGQTPVPGGSGKIDREFRVAAANARAKAEDYWYQDAIDILWKFWDEHQFLAESPEAWKKRVEEDVNSFLAQAERQWLNLDEVAKGHVNRGKYEYAINIYKKIAERFGIEKYQYRASEAMRKLQRD